MEGIEGMKVRFRAIEVSSKKEPHNEEPFFPRPYR
jgi:hypothetical protein